MNIIINNYDDDHHHNHDHDDRDHGHDHDYDVDKRVLSGNVIIMKHYKYLLKGNKCYLLQIREGSISAFPSKTFCGSMSDIEEKIYINSSDVYIYFISDSTLNDFGFRATYTMSKVENIGKSLKSDIKNIVQ